MRTRFLKTSFFFIALTGSIWGPSALAQTGPTEQKSDTDQSEQSNTDAQKTIEQANASTNASPSDSSELPDALRVPRLGTAQWLEPNVHSPIHLGPIYASSASFFFFGGDTLQFNQQNQAVSGMQYLGVIRTEIDYDKLTRFGRFTVQYLPEITIDNGIVETNFSNQTLAFNMARALNPRWTFTLQNNLSYINGHIIYGELTLDVNSVSGGGVQNPFLETTQRWLNDNTNATFNYKLNPRDQLSLSTNFQYSNSNLVTLPENSYIYGGGLNLTHALSPQKSVGLYLTVNQEEFSTRFPSTLYTGVGGTFSDRLGRSLVLQAAFGASYALAEGQGTPGQSSGTNNITGTGNITLRKDFLTSSVALEAFRGITTGPFLTNGYTDRADGTYTRRFGRRWQVSGGVAYELDKYSGGRISGTYATAHVNYLLSRSFNWFTSYARRWQSQGQNVLGNTQVPGNSVSAGLTWRISRDNGVISPVIY